MDLRDYLFDPQGNPISGATVTRKAWSATEPNPNPVLSTVSSGPDGMWEWVGITDANYDVYADVGGNKLIYKSNSRLPYALNTASIADSAITSAKILDGTIVNVDVSAAAALDVSKLQSLAANRFVAGPASGGAAVPVSGGRALVLADLPLTPAAYAYHTTTQVLTTGVFNVIVLNSDGLVENDNMHSTVSNTERLTIVTAGVYIAMGMVEFETGVGTLRILQVLRDAAVCAQITVPPVSGNATGLCVVSPPLPMTAGQTFTMRAFHDHGSNRNLNATSYSPVLACWRVGV